jgi:hypothetical protein
VLHKPLAVGEVGRVGGVSACRRRACPPILAGVRLRKALGKSVRSRRFASRMATRNGANGQVSGRRRKAESARSGTSVELPPEHREGSRFLRRLFDAPTAAVREERSLAKRSIAPERKFPVFSRPKRGGRPQQNVQSDSRITDRRPVEPKLLDPSADAFFEVIHDAARGTLQL